VPEIQAVYGLLMALLFAVSSLLLAVAGTVRGESSRSRLRLPAFLAGPAGMLVFLLWR
jgi:hypothetical protein